MTVTERIIRLRRKMPPHDVTEFAKRLGRFASSPDQTHEFLCNLERRLDLTPQASPLEIAPVAQLTVDELPAGQPFSELALWVSEQTAVAYDGDKGYMVPRDQLATLPGLCRDRLWLFDIGRADRLVCDSGIDCWHLVECPKVVDVQIMYQLVALAQRGELPKHLDLSYAVYDLTQTPRWQTMDFVTACTGDVSGEADGLATEFGNAVAVYHAGRLLETQAGAIMAEHLSPDRFKQRLSHHIQIKAALTLRHVSDLGIGIDQKAVKRLRSPINEETRRLQKRLRDHGWWPGKGADTRFDRAMTKLMEQGEIPASHATDRWQKSRDFLSNIEHPFVRSYLRYQELAEQENFLSSIGNEPIVKPTFMTMSKTGRTSCKKPPLQACRRSDRFRNLFVPRPGYVFLAADYKAAELCALAEICYQRYGESKLRDLINGGIDPHKWLASKITGKDIGGISDEERQKAKAAAFGFPGGMGIESFRQYSFSTFGVEFSATEAEAFSEKWRSALPEMNLYLKKPREYRWRNANPARWSVEIAANTALRIAGGQPFQTSNGEPYSEDFMDWVWNNIEEQAFPRKQEYKQAIANRQGNAALRKALEQEAPVVWSSGRIRSHCTYTKARNSPFQGLVADGAKSALYQLVRQGFRVVNFIHDEVIVELPEEGDHLDLARQVEKIMIEEMQKAIPHVSITVDYALMRIWYKSAKAVFDDVEKPTKLLLWEPQGDIKEEAA
jgi:DNA polymerase I-like protein with 3'-5' exonuclease and polymerase domains